MVPISSVAGETLTSPGSSYGSSVGRYLNEKSNVPSETPDQARMRDLQEELERERERITGQSPAADLQAMRRDLQQLLQIVERPHGHGGDVPPPEYGAT